MQRIFYPKGQSVVIIRSNGCRFYDHLIISTLVHDPRSQTLWTQQCQEEKKVQLIQSFLVFLVSIPTGCQE
ncbi:hypothetical protein SynA1825c_01844 [Synechococcus sp. A18-25c]|nr:hypothetical protein SynA1560_01860 [Synechococcus sp. A15-60]QNJ20145.1 hypothetical protein SynA1825c_01844 [Synechococcus sp. A18-25c]